MCTGIATPMCGAATYLIVSFIDFCRIFQTIIQTPLGVIDTLTYYNQLLVNGVQKQGLYSHYTLPTAFAGEPPDPHRGAYLYFLPVWDDYMQIAAAKPGAPWARLPSSLACFGHRRSLRSSRPRWNITAFLRPWIL